MRPLANVFSPAVRYNESSHSNDLDPIRSVCWGDSVAPLHPIARKLFCEPAVGDVTPGLGSATALLSGFDGPMEYGTTACDGETIAINF